MDRAATGHRPRRCRTQSTSTGLRASSWCAGAHPNVPQLALAMASSSLGPSASRPNPIRPSVVRRTKFCIIFSSADLVSCSDAHHVAAAVVPAFVASFVVLPARVTDRCLLDNVQGRWRRGSPPRDARSSRSLVPGCANLPAGLPGPWHRQRGVRARGTGTHWQCTLTRTSRTFPGGSQEGWAWLIQYCLAHAGVR